MIEKFDIEGMNCAACALRIEKTVSKLDFVKAVSVSLINNSMTAEFDGNVEDIINAVNNAGYRAYIKNSPLKNKNDDFQNLKRKTALNFVFSIPLLYLSMGCMLKLPFYKLFEEHILMSSFIQLILLLIIIYINLNVIKSGIKSLFKLTPDMNSLISSGVISSLIYGIYVLLKSFFYKLYGMPYFEILNSNTFFESGGMILTFVSLGKTMEAKAKFKTSNLILELNNLTPKNANILLNGNEEKIPVEKIKAKDILIVKEGDYIPTDGVIIEGNALIDESYLTGESIPVYKKEKDEVLSGTINTSGYFKMKANKIIQDTVLSKIIKLTESTLENKPPIQKIADKIIFIFVPVVILLSFMTFLFWIIFTKNFELGLSYGICTLVISCPCALGLAIPVSITVGMGVGAKSGILFKNSDILEKSEKIDTVVFDKTGTLTKGKITIDKIYEDKLNKNEILKLSASIEQFSNHPYALAIKNKYSGEIYPVYDFLQTQGLGIEGIINDKKYFIGNKNYVQKQNITILDDNFEGIYLTDEENILGRISFSDEIKEEAKDVIQKLLSMNKEVIMLTGDNDNSANKTALKIGIKNVISNVLPDMKNYEIKKLKEENKKVLMIGDGINDAPALAKADISVSFNTGSDIAICTSDIILIKNDLYNIINAINLSGLIYKNIKQNLFWALFYNIIFIPVAMGVFTPFNIKLTSDISALLMSLSSLFVVLNALRINNFKPIKKEENMKKEILIEGMMCNHCVSFIKENLLKESYTKNVEISLENKKVIIELNQEVDDSIIKNLIEKIGYKVIEIKKI